MNNVFPATGPLTLLMAGPGLPRVICDCRGDSMVFELDPWCVDLGGACDLFGEYDDESPCCDVDGDRSAGSPSAARFRGLLDVSSSMALSFVGELLLLSILSRPNLGISLP